MLVEDIMTPDPYTLETTDSLFQARQLMMEKKIRHIPLMEKGVLHSIISQRDILKAERSSVLDITLQERIEQEKQVSLQTISTDSIVTVSPKAHLLEAARYIQKHKLGCLPVVKDDELVGIITDSDFVNVAINLLEIEEDHEIDEELEHEAEDDLDLQDLE